MGGREGGLGWNRVLGVGGKGAMQESVGGCGGWVGLVGIESKVWE